MRELIKKHGLILLNLYGVKEKTIDNSPEALTAFINILEEEIEQEIKKVLEEIKSNIKKRRISSDFIAKLNMFRGLNANNCYNKAIDEDIDLINTYLNK